jgi:hypothetical protein
MCRPIMVVGGGVKGFVVSAGINGGGGRFGVFGVLPLLNARVLARKRRWRSIGSFTRVKEQLQKGIFLGYSLICNLNIIKNKCP